MGGEKFDGHNFCLSAIKNGAKAVVVEHLPKSLPKGIVAVVVEDTLKAYQDLAAYNRDQYDIPVVAVTGSVGKTSTKDLIAAALGKCKKVLKTLGNHNNEIGVPLTLLKLQKEHEVAVLEMGMRGLGQIKLLAQIAKPTIGVVTNIGETHVELLGSVANSALAKRELVESLSDEGVAILNFDDPYVKEMVEVAKGKVIFFGLSSGADIRAKNIRDEGMGTFFECVNKVSNEEYSVTIPLLGDHNVYNALAAIAVASAMQIPTEDILAGLAEAEITSMRQELLPVNDMIFINDTYNSSPSSMRAALKTLGRMKGKRKVVVLGDMLELGEFSDKEHKEIGREVVKCGIDLVVTVGSKSCHISIEAAEHGIPSWHFKNHSFAADTLATMLQKGDSVLFKGSRGMHIDELLNAVKDKLAQK